MSKTDKVFAVVFAFWNKEVGLKLTRARLKDLGCDEDTIDLYIDGDIMDMSEEQLRSKDDEL